ncbi:MAG: OmpA family protein, partial [Bacteroidales bacterium]|nr:OmpA family protein [Bacteroidales bacterium]
YILIDDIKVTKIDSCTNCKCYQSQLKLSVLDENEEFSASISYGEEPYIIKWSNGDTTKTIKKPKDGSYSISLVDAVGCKEELVFAVPFNNQAIEEDDPTSVTTLLQLKQGESLKLEKILFESNSSLLLSNSFKELNSIVQFLDANSTYKIEISGYTDNVGDNSHNQKLSENRAQSIVDYLINSGIEDERLVAMGYGELFPVASNKTVSGRKLNRRVEVKLLYK